MIELTEFLDCCWVGSLSRLTKVTIWHVMWDPKMFLQLIHVLSPAECSERNHLWYVMMCETMQLLSSPAILSCNWKGKPPEPVCTEYPGFTFDEKVSEIVTLHTTEQKVQDIDECYSGIVGSLGNGNLCNITLEGMCCKGSLCVCVCVCVCVRVCVCVCVCVCVVFFISRSLHNSVKIYCQNHSVSGSAMWMRQQKEFEIWLLQGCRSWAFWF